MTQKTVIKNFLQSATEIYYKVRLVLQSVTGCHYKVCQVLQSVAVITKWDVTVIWFKFFWYTVFLAVITWLLFCVFFHFFMARILYILFCIFLIFKIAALSILNQMSLNSLINWGIVLLGIGIYLLSDYWLYYVH